ncbi:MAG: hypothetical protein AB1489_14110 [Acidobacteriota bacterium]
MSNIFYFRIQNGRSSTETADTGEVTAFISLYTACQDLLGRQAQTGTSQTSLIEEQGGLPTLIIFTGEAIKEESAISITVKPDSKPVRLFSINQVWSLWLNTLMELLPAHSERLLEWPHTPEGWEALEKEFPLRNYEADVIAYQSYLTQIC